MTDKNKVSSRPESYNRIEALLEEIHLRGIQTGSELRKPENRHLYEGFGEAAKEFIDDYIFKGNALKLYALKDRFGIDREDLSQDYVIKVMTKLDYVLKKPLDMQPNTIKKMIDNSIIDEWRKQIHRKVRFVSCDASLCAKGEEEFTLYDTLSDYKTPETFYLEGEGQKELSKTVLKTLKDHPAELMTFLACAYDDIKPSDLSQSLLKEGATRTYRQVLQDTLWELDTEAALSILSETPDEELLKASFKLQSGDRKEVAKQLSRLKDRAVKRLR